MANTKFNETIYLGASIITNSSDPLDGRLRIDSKDDLSDVSKLWGETVGGYGRVYPGMVVYCDNEKEAYRYVGPFDGNGVLNSDANDSENWRLESSEEGSMPNLISAINSIVESVGLSGSTSGASGLENIGYEPSENVIISAATNAKEADELLAETIIDNELVTASALNDLNNRIKSAIVDVSIEGKDITFTSEDESTKEITLPYVFDDETKTIEDDNNVKFGEEQVSGEIQISADVEFFNCGEYE